MCVHHFSPFQRGAINFPLHRFRASIRRSLAVRKWVEPYHIVGLTPQNARASDPNVWRGEQASNRASPIAGAIEAKRENELGAPRESAGAILAIIVCYFKNGLPERSSNHPPEGVKPQGEANGMRPGIHKTTPTLAPLCQNRSRTFGHDRQDDASSAGCC